MYRLLIVDDEPLTRRFLKQTIPILSTKWEVIAEAMDGQEAIEILEKCAVDLVITDIKMPGINGIDLCKNIYKSYPVVKCVLLSGYGEFEYAKKAIEYNVYNYLLKPIVNNELKKVLDELSDQFDQENKKNQQYISLIDEATKYHEEISSKYLRAIINESNLVLDSMCQVVKGKELMKNKGAICIIYLFEETLIQNNIDLSQMPSCKLLLYKICKQMASKNNMKVCVDSNQNTVLLISLSEEDKLVEIIDSVYEKINEKFYQENFSNCFLAVGSQEKDLLQMNVSYSHAKNALIQYFLSQETNSKFFIYEEKNYKVKTKEISSLLMSIIYAVLSNDNINLQVLIRNLSKFISNNVSVSLTLDFSYYFINYLNENLKIEKNFLEQAYIIMENSNEVMLNEISLNDMYSKLMKCVNKNSENNKKIKEANVIVEYAKQYIFDYYMEPLSLSLIADKLSISSTYLSNLFHKSVGTSYIKFLTKVRLKEACFLLKSNRGMNLETITQKVGYVSVKHFSQVFKKYYHVSPSEYRNQA